MASPNEVHPDDTSTISPKPLICRLCMESDDESAVHHNIFSEQSVKMKMSNILGQHFHFLQVNNLFSNKKY